MTSVVTKSIGSGGGRDYSTISAWVTYVNGRSDITAAGVDEVHVGELYNDSVFTESVFPAITVTRDATHTVTLRPHAGEGFAANIATDGLRYNESSGVAIRLTNATASVSLSGLANVIFDGLQFQSTGAFTGSFVAFGTGTFNACIFDEGTATTSATSPLCVIGGASKVTNIVIVVRQAARVGVTLSQNGSTNDYVTLINLSGSSTLAVSGASNRTSTWRNCAFIGYSGQNVFSAFTGGTYSNNASDGTVNLGTSNASGITPSSEFISASGTINLRLKSTSTIKALGTVVSTTTVDIVGVTRSASTPSIGAYEYVAGAPAPAPPPRRWARIPLGALN